MVKKTDGTLCAKCTAICCNYITVDIDIPTSKKEEDEIRWYLLHEGISLLAEEDRWLLQCPTRCEHLQADNRCGIYDTRPITCRKYSTENCDFRTIHEGWETDYVEIKNAEEYAVFLKKRKAEQRAKARAYSQKAAKRKVKAKG